MLVRRAQSFAERLRLGIAVIHGEAQDAESDQVDGRHSPPTVKTTGAIHPSMEIPCNASKRLTYESCYHYITDYIDNRYVYNTQTDFCYASPNNYT